MVVVKFSLKFEYCIQIPQKPLSKLGSRFRIVFSYVFIAFCEHITFQCGRFENRGAHNLLMSFSWAHNFKIIFGDDHKLLLHHHRLLLRYGSCLLRTTQSVSCMPHCFKLNYKYCCHHYWEIYPLLKCAYSFFFTWSVFVLC